MSCKTEMRDPRAFGGYPNWPPYHNGMAGGYF